MLPIIHGNIIAQMTECGSRIYEASNTLKWILFFIFAVNITYQKSKVICSLKKKKHLLEHFGNFKKHNITGQCTGLYRKRIIKCFI